MDAKEAMHTKPLTTCMRSNGGIDTESSYPYEMQNSICRYSSQSIGATVHGFNWVHMGLNGNENTLLEAVTSVGPISVMIDSKHDKFHHYSGGVYYEPQCSSVKHDHEILVIGYIWHSGWQGLLADKEQLG